MRKRLLFWSPVVGIPMMVHTMLVIGSTLSTWLMSKPHVITPAVAKFQYRMPPRVRTAKGYVWHVAGL